MFDIESLYFYYSLKEKSPSPDPLMSSDTSNSSSAAAAAAFTDDLPTSLVNPNAKFDFFRDDDEELEQDEDEDEEEEEDENGLPSYRYKSHKRYSVSAVISSRMRLIFAEHPHKFCKIAVRTLRF